MKSPYIAEVLKYENESAVTMFVAVCSKQLRSRKDGGQFLSLRLSDKTGQCEGVMWEEFADCVGLFDTNDVIKLRAKVGRYNGKLQLVIEKLRKAQEGEFELSDYAPHTVYDVDLLWARLEGYIASFKDAHLRALMQSFLEDAEIRAALREAPAAKAMHHAWIGGLLEHIVSLMGLCDMVAGHYPEIHRDLLLAGAVLHDIGKLEELRWGTAFDYTMEGQMLGHITLGIGMIEKRIAAIPGFPPRLRLLVEHLVLSHHGRYEFGSPKLPMIPEAVLLHYLDDLDAKMHTMRAEFAKCEWNGRAPGEMTDWVRSMERPLLNTQAYLKAQEE